MYRFFDFHPYSAQHGPCQPNPCLHDGACIVNGDAYDCHCPDQFTGPNCQGKFPECSLWNANSATGV